MLKKTQLFGYDVSSWPKWLILIIGATGIFTSFLLQGTSQEHLYKKYKFKESVFFTFVQFFGYFVLSSGFFFKWIRGKANLHVPLSYYIQTSIALVSSMAFSNLSVERLSYPTAVLFKSSKLIPVMVGGFLFLKKKYSVLEILSVLLIVAGLCGISISDKISQNKFDAIGLVMAVTSLFFDAIASNFQEKAFSSYNAPQNEVISMLYFIGMIILFVASLITGQLSRGVSMCMNHPGVVVDLTLFAFLGGIGVQFVFLLISTFGSLIAVMVTSTRKAMTVMLSFLLFPDKKFTLYHFFSVMAISAGLSVNFLFKKPKNETERQQLLVEKSSDAEGWSDQSVSRV